MGVLLPYLGELDFYHVDGVDWNGHLALWSPDTNTFTELLPAGTVYEYASGLMGDVGLVRVLMADEGAEWTSASLEERGLAELGVVALAIEFASPFIFLRHSQCVEQPTIKNRLPVAFGIFRQWNHCDHW